MEITWHETTPVSSALPTQVVLEVTEAEQAVKGNSATNIKKDAVLETGFKIDQKKEVTLINQETEIFVID